VKKTRHQTIWEELFKVFPQFRVKGSLAYIQPVASILRGLFRERSIDPESFYVWVFIQPLYIPSDHIFFNFGWRVGRDWKLADPELIPKLRTAIVTEGLPFLESVQGPSDIPEAALKWKQPAGPIIQQIVGYSYARIGDVNKACEVLDTLVENAKQSGYGRSLVPEVQAFRDLLLNDYNQACRLLEEWERDTRRKLKLPFGA